MVTGSVNSSVNVEMPPALQRISTALKFDTSGVMKCLIQSFEYTFYHNLLLMATIPYLTVWLANGYSTIGVAAIRISYDNKRRIAQDDEEHEALDEEERLAIYELTESANGTASILLLI